MKLINARDKPVKANLKSSSLSEELSDESNLVVVCE
jgi:hypothetical protein